jgi:ribosomal protein L7/L12
MAGIFQNTMLLGGVDLAPLAGQGSDADVAALLKRGERLLASRLYRELHGCGLKEAKEAVETLPRDAESPAP